MPNEDLTSIPGLQDNHARALANKLGITNVRALAGANKRTVYDALQNVRSRPSLALVAAWQRNARTMIGDAGIDKSEWHHAASFVVIFAQRQVGGVWERRLEAEQTDQGPKPPHQEWPGWDCQPLCGWMRGQLGLPAEQADPEAGAAGEAGEAGLTPAVEHAVGAAPSRAERAELRVDSARITDATHELDLITGGDLTEVPPEDLRPPVRLNLTVSGGRSGQRVQAAAWFRRRGEPGWSPQEPVTISASGQAEFDLSSVPPGEHQIRLLAWATDAGATLAAVTLPQLTFRQHAS